MGTNRSGAQSAATTMVLFALTGVIRPSHADEPAAAPVVEVGVDTPASGPPRVELMQKDADRIQLVAKALPALSEDGKRVAIGVIGEDGARGDPNLAVQIRDVDSDALLGHATILAAGQAFTPSLGARIARANQQLDRTRWTPFASTAAPQGSRTQGDEDEVSSLQIGELTIALAGTHFSVRERSGRALVSRRVPGWAAPSSPGPDGFRCDNPPKLLDAHLDLPRRALLVRVGFFGTDSCWEPDSRWHTVRLPKS